MKKAKVAFICVHNSCRSQIAEALGKLLAGDVFESYSAGTETKDKINEDATRLMKEIYNIDMEISQKPKTLDKLPPIDIAITERSKTSVTSAKSQSALAGSRT